VVRAAGRVCMVGVVEMLSGMVDGMVELVGLEDVKEVRFKVCERVIARKLFMLFGTSRDN
jgi:aromatic ring hydroxylase